MKDPIGKVLRMDDVLERTGLSRSMIYKLQQQGDFPQSVSLGNRAVGWLESDILAWLTSKNIGRLRTKSPSLPLIYMAGRMGTPINNKIPGGEYSCWRLFDVSTSSSTGMLEADTGGPEALIAPPETKVFYGTDVQFSYSGPWKASGSYHGYMHGITSCSPESAHDAAYRGALQGISRADIVTAYLDDHEAYGTLVEIGVARALGKKLVVVTSPALYNAPLFNGWDTELWFAVRAADRHIKLDSRKGSLQRDYWCDAHRHIAAVVAEWYPITTASSLNPHR
jgi:prophage regulatory protein